MTCISVDCLLVCHGVVKTSFPIILCKVKLFDMLVKGNEQSGVKVFSHLNYKLTTQLPNSLSC